MTRLRGASRGAFCYQLERLFGQGTSIGSTEGELLDRFVSGRDGAAFEALVARHGPMVLGVCRQLLRDPNDVDDAFQATFLVLVRKAGTLRRCDLFGNWLYGVAYRVAARARTQSARRLVRVNFGQDAAGCLAAAECQQEESKNQATLLDQGPVLHQELSHLPEKYRVPIVLCYFEGLTHDEAASRLGWPLGTVKGRLARARDLLRRRLTRRGVTLSTTGLASLLTDFEAKAAVPASLQLLTLKGAEALAFHVGASFVTTSAVSLPVHALAEGVLHIMIANQVKTVVLPLFLLAASVATGVVVAATQLSGGPADAGKANQVTAASTNSAKFKSSGPGAQAPVPKADVGTSSVSAQVAQQLSAERTSFAQLLSKLRDPEIGDIDRLFQWSLKMLEADHVLGTSDADRLAAYEAHRDRMKTLHEFTQTIPVSDKNQPVKADHAQSILQQAEEALKNIRETSGAPSIINMTGSGMMRGMMGSGRMGMMGAGRMAAMASATKNAAEPSPNQGESSPSPAATTEVLSKKESTTAGTKDQTPARSKTQSSRPRDGSAAGGQMTGGGFGGMGGGMGGMGGGMGGMGGGMGGSMSPEGAIRQLRWSIAGWAAELASRDTNAQSKAVFKKLEEPISMSFAHDTPLEDVLKYIKQATTTNNSTSIPIYVDPKGLKEAEATLQSSIQLDLEGVPLKTTLRLMLKQIGLAYCIRDGVLIISSVQGINEELREAKSEIDATDPRLEGSQTSEGGLRGMGGMR